jgi:cytoskeletal protein RodZ
MSTFILATLSLDYHILLPSNKSIMSLPPITLGGLGILGIGTLIQILTPHLKEKLESHVFSDVSQVLHQALDCESQAKESRSFSRSSEKPRNKSHVNIVEHSSKSLDDEEAELCVTK